MAKTIVEMREIEKSFNENKVLRKVDFKLKEGSIHALLGAKVVTAALLYLAVMWTGGAKVLKESIGFIKQRFLRNPS